MFENFKVKSEAEYNALTPEEKGEYNAMLKMYQADQKKKEAEKLKNDLKEELKKDYDAILAEKVAEINASKSEEDQKKDQELNDKIEKLEAKLQRTNFADRAERTKTMSELIEAKFSTTEGEQMLKDFANGVKGSLNTEVNVSKATFLKPTSNGGYVAPEMSGIYGQGHEDMHMRDLLRVLPTASDLIKYLRLTPTAGSELPEITAEGATKKELEFTPEVVQVTVKKIAGYITVSDESLADIVGFRAFLATELPLAYLEAEDNYILRHDTDGLLTLAQDWTPQGNVTAASNVWDILVAAGTQIRENRRKPTAAVVAPDVYQELLINKADDNAYTYPVVADANGVLRVGTMPIYESTVMLSGEFLVGDFLRGAKLWQKESVNVRYSDQHANNFIQNLTTIRVEGRVALEVSMPDAFVKGNIAFATS